jgi:hypothetical protein
VNKYRNASIFREALESKIDSLAKKLAVDVDRLRRDVAFDRFLVRLFTMPSPPWALKGGYAMQLRTDSARATRDVDMALKDAKLFSEDKTERAQAIRAELAKQAALDLGDFFTFLITGPTSDLSGPPEGGIRFNVEARLDDRTFQKFILDIGAGDVWSDPLEELESSDLLKFAGFEPTKFLAIPKEQQFAEKLHAYTLPRPDARPNSRVKDLIDMNLLIGEGMNEKQLSTALNSTFERRNTHQLNLTLAPPPTTWGASFTSMAIECDLDPNIDVGFKIVSDYLKKL